MDMSLETWISELDMDDYNFIDQYQNSFCAFSYVDELTPLVIPSMGEQEKLQQQSSSSESHTSSPSLYLQCDTDISNIFPGSSLETCDSTRPSKTTKSSTPNDAVLEEVSPQVSQLNENPENYSLEPKDEVVRNGDVSGLCSDSKGLCDSKSDAPKVGQKRSNAVIRTPVEAQDRVIAERKRREKLSQRFIALSAIVPGLKKMDKASVLGDAIKYLKQLQEHVKLLEEKITKKSEESVVFVKRSQLSVHDDTSSCDENFDGHIKEALPEIEARISEKNVLIRIHSEMQKGLAMKLLCEIEKNHLNVVNSSFLPFGQYAMDITVVAQMDEEFCMTVKDLVRNLRSAFLKFML